MPARLDLPKHILIVDDEKSVRLMLQKGLSNLHQPYVLDEASSGSEALQKIKQKRYDLVITDYLMQGMSGLELAQKIDELTPQTPVILMTAFGALSLKQLAGGDKFAAYFDKPIELAKIREVVHHVLGKTTVREQAIPKPPSQMELIKTLLEQFLNTTDAHLIILLDTSGNRIALQGDPEGKDIDSICALIAASFMASAELARMLGNHTVFKASRYEGPHYDIYAHHISGDFLLAIVFGEQSKIGMIRFYASKFIEELEPLLQFVVPSNAIFDEGFTQGVQKELEEMFDV